MVRHVILWKLNESLSKEEKAEAQKKIQADLEGLNGKIDGLLSLRIRIPDIASSNADVMLDAELADEDALTAYQTNPLHVAAAAFVRQNTQIRLCVDYTV